MSGDSEAQDELRDKAIHELDSDPRSDPECRHWSLVNHYEQLEWRRGRCSIVIRLSDSERRRVAANLQHHLNLLDPDLDSLCPMGFDNLFEAATGWLGDGFSRVYIACQIAQKFCGDLLQWTDFEYVSEDTFLGFVERLKGELPAVERAALDTAITHLLAERFDEGIASLKGLARVWENRAHEFDDSFFDRESAIWRSARA